MSEANIEIYDPDSLKMILNSFPINLTNLYFENKKIHGFKPDLHEEIQDLLVEMQLLENNMQKALKLFIHFIDKHEIIVQEKDEKIFDLSNELEKFILKITQENFGKERMHEQIQELLERNNLFQLEMDDLFQQCQIYENFVKNCKCKNEEKKSKNKISTKEFLEHIEEFKLCYPELFKSEDKEKLEETLQENRHLRKQLIEYKLKVQELEQNKKDLKLHLEKYKKLYKTTSLHSESLKIQINFIKKRRSEFLEDIKREVDSYKNIRNSYRNLKIRSVSPEKIGYWEFENEINNRNRVCRIPRPIKPKNISDTIESVEHLKNTVRRKTKLLSHPYLDLLTDLERSNDRNGLTSKNEIKFTLEFLNSVEEDVHIQSRNEKIEQEFCYDSKENSFICNDFDNMKEIMLEKIIENERKEISIKEIREEHVVILKNVAKRKKSITIRDLTFFMTVLPFIKFVKTILFIYSKIK